MGFWRDLTRGTDGDEDLTPVRKLLAMLVGMVVGLPVALTLNSCLQPDQEHTERPDRPPSLRVGEPPTIGAPCWPERAERRTSTGVVAVCRPDITDGKLRWALP